MPQFDFAHVFWPQIFWLGLSFAVLYFGVVRLTLPKLGAVMGAREDRISGDLAAAKSAKEAADQVSELYQRELEASREASRSVIAEAKSGAAKQSEAALAKAQANAEQAIADAETRIAAAVAAARQALRDAAAEGAQAIVGRLTGTEPSLDMARAEVDARMAG